MKNFDEQYEVRVPRRGEDGEPVKDPRTGENVMETVVVSREGRVSRDRTFTIGGREFSYRASVAPEAILEWLKMTGGEIEDLTEEKGLEIYDRTILAFLVPGQEEAWRSVRALDAEHPLTLQDMSALVRWLFEEQTGRPTSQPSRSSGGDGNGGTGTGSTVASSSVAGAV